MTTQYTPTLKLALPVTGELSGTWGDVVNDNITSMIEQAIAGLATINSWTGNAHTLTTANGTTSESRCAMLVAATGGGAPSAAAEIICPAAAKLYVLQNNTSYAVTLKTSAGTGVAVAAGDTAFLFCDGTNVNSCVTTIVNGHITGNLTVDGNATINGNTTLGNATSDTVTVTARVASNVLPSADNTYDLGASANAWKDLYIDGTATMALVAISGGTINGVSIGATTPATFLAVDNLSLDGNTIASTDTNGNIVIAPNGTGDVQLDADTVRVGDSGAAVSVTSNGAGALTVTTGGAADLTLSTNSGTDSGTVVIANGVNGNITLTPNGTGDVILSADRVQIGDSNTDTTLTTNGTGSLNLTTNNGTNSGTIQIAQGANGNITLTPNGTGSVSVPKLVWSNGTSTRVPYLTTGGQFTDSANMTFDGTTLTVAGLNNTGNTTLGNASGDTVTVTGTITSNLIFTDNTYDIGASGATRPRNLYLAGDATIGGSIVATTLDLTNLEVTNIKAKDGTAAMTIADSTGAVTVSSAFSTQGNTTLGNAAADNVTVTGTVTSNLLFTDDTYDIGASGATRPRREFLSQSLYIGAPTVSWSTTTRKVLQFGGTGSAYFSASQQVTNACFGSLAWNAYGTSTDNEWKYYTGTDRANLFQIAAGGYTWYRAAVGTADATITWTTSLNLDSSGNMGLGGSTTAYNNARLTVVTAATATRQNLAAIDKTTANWVRFTNPEFSTDASMGLILKVFPDSDSRQGAGVIASGGATNNSTNLSLFVTDSNALSFAAYTAAPSGADVLHTWNRTATSTAMTLSTTAELILDSGTSGGRVTLSPGATQNTISSTTTGFGAYNILRQQATQYQWLNASSTQVMTLNASGYLGLTSTNPTYQLDLGGGTTVSSRIQLQRGSDDGNQNLLLGWGSISSTRSSVSLSNAQTTLSFDQIGSDGTRTNLYINSNGTIGIGATNTYSWDITRFKAIYFGSASSGNYFSVSQQFTAACAGGLSWNAYGSGNNTFKYMTTGDPASRLSMAGNQIRLYGAPTGTADADITFTEMLGLQKDYTVSLQGATQATGTGITFPATQNASSNANTLDDYEEGTWTPAFVFSGGGEGSVTYSNQQGLYTKVGGLVTVQCLAVVSNKGSASGTMSMVMPFTAAAGANYSAASLTWNFITYSTNSYIISAQAGNGSANLFFYNEPNGSTKTSLDVSQCGTNFEIIFTVTYRTS